ncbi:hypothetical protein ACVNPS_08820 [Candidatus Bipolaricaulota sp. J31]
MMKKRGPLLLFVLLFGSMCGAVELVRFESSGRFAGGMYWLEDVKLHQKALWEFVGVPQGVITLRLEAFAAVECRKIRDNKIYLRLFYRVPRVGRWETADIALRPVGPVEDGLLPLRGEVSFSWFGGDSLEVVVKRTYACDPHIGLTEGSLSFPARGPEIVPSPPPPPPPPTPLPPPAPCYEIPGARCYPDGETLKAAYGIEIPDVPLEERTLLPETSGPQEAYVLGPGHYWGVLGGELAPWGAPDTQDWYRITLEPGKAAVVYIEHIGLWDYEVFIYDICGHYQEKVARRASYCVVPYTEDIETYLLRIFRTEGAGEYILSVFYVDLCP